MQYDYKSKSFIRNKKQVIPDVELWYVSNKRNYANNIENMADAYAKLFKVERSSVYTHLKYIIRQTRKLKTQKQLNKLAKTYKENSEYYNYLLTQTGVSKW